MEPLILALGDRDREVRRSAAWVLGQLGATASPALGTLREHAGSWTTDDHTRRACRDAVRDIRQALAMAPKELESAPAPGGRGTELSAGGAPTGTGKELTAADQLAASGPSSRKRRLGWPPWGKGQRG